MTAETAASGEVTFGASALRSRLSDLRLGRLAVAVLPVCLLQNYVVGWALHYFHQPKAARALTVLALPAHDDGPRHRPMPMSGWDQFVHYVRDSTLALPFVFVVLLVATLCAWRLLRRRGVGADTVASRLVFAVVAAVAVAAASVPSVWVHGRLFDEKLPASITMGQHLVEVAAITMRYTFALALGYVLLFGVPWQRFDRPLPEVATQPEK
jgi:hypothetical protein